VTKPFDRVIISPNSPLIRGLPDAIPGQSGSGIYNAEGNAIALLAWSWGGYCAGQQTHWLWRIATERSLADVPARPPGLEEVSSTPEDAAFIRPITEDGIFNLVDSRLAQLPIWLVPAIPDPQPQPEPCPKSPECPECPEVCPPDYMKVTDNERALIEFIRSQQSETSRFGEFLRTIDWVALTRQVIEIIKLFQSLQ
jgi:hypothetical protein